MVITVSGPAGMNKFPKWLPPGLYLTGTVVPHTFPECLCKTSACPNSITCVSSNYCFFLWVLREIFFKGPIEGSLQPLAT